MIKKIGKLIVILGPTAVGKTVLSIKLALKLSSKEAKRKFGIKGVEIVSADSRQVYKGMDVGTGKVTKKEMKGVPHYLLDVASPKRRFTVVQYQKLALKAIKKILKKGKLPFLVGGSGFYIQAVVDGLIIPKVEPDWQLRYQLEKLTSQELFNKLKREDPRRAKTIDKNNKRRLVRALEIIMKTKKPVPHLKKRPPKLDILMIGIKKSQKEIKKLIRRRLIKRLNKGMIDEVRKLKKNGLSWKRFKSFGLEYRYIAQYLQGKINYKKMLEKIQKESEHFAKRQMTWFKGDKRIKWIKSQKRMEELIEKFLQ